MRKIMVSPIAFACGAVLFCIMGGLLIAQPTTKTVDHFKTITVKQPAQIHIVHAKPKVVTVMKTIVMKRPLEASCYQAGLDLGRTGDALDAKDVAGLKEWNKRRLMLHDACHWVCTIEDNC